MTIQACGPASSRNHVEIACGIGQSVRMVDADAVDQAFGRTSAGPRRGVASKTARSSWRRPASEVIEKNRR